MLAAVAIVALRLIIGMHFYLEGAAKLKDPKPYSAGFLGNAKGPLAPMYRDMVWDADGLYRLSSKETLAAWDNYRNRVASHYHFDEKQTAAAKKILDDYTARYKWVLGTNAEEIDQYQKSLKRRDENQKQASRAALSSLRAHDARIEAERQQLIGPVLSKIDKMWKDFENSLNDLATTEQWKRHGRLSIAKVGRRPLDSEFVDRFIPYFDLAVGICLVLGLFTRPAAIAGGLFLLSVCASQWPGAEGAAPIYYQAVEAVALFALAAVGAGRFAGLDYVFGGLRGYCCPPRRAAAEGARQ